MSRGTNECIDFSVIISRIKRDRMRIIVSRYARRRMCIVLSRCDVALVL